MKKLYNSPEFEVIDFMRADVITDSPSEAPVEGDESDGGFTIIDIGKLF